MMDIKKADILVFSAHPDDAELGCGGTIKDLTMKGFAVTLIDATKGELGSRGNIELRAKEAQISDAILGVQQRINLGLEDGNLHPNTITCDLVALYIRIVQPSIILFPPSFERHPDHEGMHEIVRHAYFTSGLHKKELRYNDTPTIPWRPHSLYCYIQAYHQEPDFIVNVSHTFAAKISSIEAYSSQVYVPNSPHEGPDTYISGPQFMDSVHARARYFGSMIHAEYGEGFLRIEPLGLSSLSVLLR